MNTNKAEPAESPLSDAAWEGPARAGDIPSAIEEFVRLYDFVTFPELVRRFEPYTETSGTYDFMLGPADLNVVLWAGLSAGFCDAVGDLMRQGRIHPVASDYLTYLMDGGMLRIPLAKSPPKAGYKKLHWMPVAFRHGPMP